MDSIASAAIKYGSRRTRELLFEPFDTGFMIRSWLRMGTNDPRTLELKRLRPYYRGTRALAWLGVLMFIPPFIIPFTMPFIGFSGIMYLLIAYIAVFIAVNVIGLFVEVGMDAILALEHERGTSFYDGTRTFLKFTMASPGQAIRYMGAKLIVDTLLLSFTMLLYMPAMFALIWVLSNLVHALTIHAPSAGIIAILGFLVVVVLALAAAFISMLISVPASAFYGYYTEEAVKRIRHT
jgi:hypothetical protein